MKTLLLLVLVICTAKASILDDDHDFMKGFETGVMMRSSLASIEEFGCKEPKTNWDIQNTIEFYLKTLNQLSSLLPDDSDFLPAFQLVNEYVEGIWQLIAVVDKRDEIDDYCKGLLFGRNGFQLITRVATIARSGRKPSSWFSGSLLGSADKWEFLGNLLGTGVKKLGEKHGVTTDL